LFLKHKNPKSFLCFFFCFQLYTMSGSGGVSIARNRGENRFYVSPGIRKQQQLQQLKQQQQQQKPSISKNSTVEIEKRKESDQCGSNCSVSGRVGPESNSTNLDRFLEYTTPVVPAQFLPKVINETFMGFCWFLVFCKKV